MQHWHSMALAATLLGLNLTPSLTAAVSKEGVALVVLFDTSSSMDNSVRDRLGQETPKQVIALRALETVARQLQTYATNSPVGSRQVQLGLFEFSGEGARQALPLGPFDFSALQAWCRRPISLRHGTPLGRALETAGNMLLKSDLAHKHVLILTDGANTIGTAPGKIMPDLQTQATKNETSLAVHFVGFDVDAKVFDAVKLQGATVLSAWDEKQLNLQLDYILKRKILLEDDEPPAKK